MNRFVVLVVVIYVVGSSSSRLDEHSDSGNDTTTTEVIDDQSPQEKEQTSSHVNAEFLKPVPENRQTYLLAKRRDKNDKDQINRAQNTKRVLAKVNVNQNMGVGSGALKTYEDTAKIGHTRRSISASRFDNHVINAVLHSLKRLTNLRQMRKRIIPANDVNNGKKKNRVDFGDDSTSSKNTRFNNNEMIPTSRKISDLVIRANPYENVDEKVQFHLSTTGNVMGRRQIVKTSTPLKRGRLDVSSLLHQLKYLQMYDYCAIIFRGYRPYRMCRPNFAPPPHVVTTRPEVWPPVSRVLQQPMMYMLGGALGKRKRNK